MVRRNPFPEKTLFHKYFAIFTRLTAPSDSDVVKLIYRNTGHLTTVNALQTFRYRLRTGGFAQLKGECISITDLALQPRSCSPIELEEWTKDNVL